jgi:hypothetical protein
VHTVPVDSLIVIENGVPDDSKISNETAYTTEAWIRLCTVPVDSVIVTNNTVADDSKIINETVYTTEAWVRPCTQSLFTR